MNANQIKNHLAQVFEQDYQGYEHFVEHVINLIFTGDDAYEALPVPEDYLTDENRQRANESGILQIQKVGTIDAEEPIDLFDITLSDKKELQYNRVGIQQFIRSSLFPFTNAFMLFHNKSTEGKDWRFSFAYKETTIKGMTSAKRYTYLFGKNHRARTASERFVKLAEETKDTRNLLNAFSVEALSKAFFDEYKEQYKSFCGFLYEHKNDTEYFGKEFLQWEDKYLRDYVKKMMGRITFIYFLQRKGWMNGDMEYMQKAFANSACQDDYLDAFLEPLFFGVLNTKPEDRKALFAKEGWDMSLLDEWKDVPYLNGGLFERDNQDKPKSKFPAEMFKDLFDFYARYNFTIDENDPDDAEVGVDPEMLGHIFENLLEDNKDKGAFYTPKEIVRYMSEESIAQYLKTHAEEALHPAIDTLIKEKKVDEALQNKAVASAIYALLQEVKVCDPAIGSGAFPMGVLNVLYHARLMLYGFIKPQHEFSPADVKREIIQNNIYGVDIEKGAIDIARLRFWLSIVVDSNQPEALPNFDYKFMQGNSLLEEFGGIDLSSLQNQVMQTTMYEPQRDLFGNVDDNQMKMTFTQKETVDNLQANLEKYFNIDDHTQKQAVKEEISDTVKNHISFNIELRKKQCLRFIHEANEAISDEESQIEDIKARFPEDKMPADEIRKHEKKISELKMVVDRNNKKVCQYDSVSRELETIDLTSNESFFLWHTWFRDVFDKGGFDVVIGNPPYVNVQLMTDSEKELYKKCFSVFIKRCDLFALFVELGLICLSSNDGVITFIIPSVVHSNMSYTKLRDLILNNHWLKEVCYTGGDVFNAPTVDTTILICNKKGNQNIILKNAINFANPIMRTVPADYFALFDNVISVGGNDDSESLFSKLFNDNFEKVEDHFDVFQGIVTGNNPAFIFENKSEARAKGIEKSLLHPLCHGRDIEKFVVRSRDRRILYIDGSVDIDEYPKTKEWLLNFKERLETRREVKRNVIEWYGLQWPRVKSELDLKEKILLQNTRNESLRTRIAATLDDTSVYGTQGLNFIIPKDDQANLHYLLGILNSKLINYLFATKFLNLAIKAEYVKQIRIPTAKAKQQQAIIKLVDKILAAKKADPQADTSAIESKIDSLVYQLYGLSENEIAMIEQ